MRFLTLLAVLGLQLVLVFGYAIEPSITWPTEYHFSGEKIDLFSGVVKPFEIWYSEQRNKSRIDYYGGLVKRIFDSALQGDEDQYKDTKVYMFHTRADKSENPLAECKKTVTMMDFEDFLPNLEGFEFAGQSHHSGKDVSVWKIEKEKETDEYRVTLYVTQGEDNVMIPVQRVEQSFNIDNGGLQSHVVENYYSYHSNIRDEDFAVDVSKCAEVFPFDIEWAHSRLDPHIESDVQIAFNAYKKHHKREYEQAEHEMRKRIYHRNWKLVKDHNNQNLGYKLTMNQFADRTDPELRYLAASRFTEPIIGTDEFPYTAEKLEEMAAKLPDEFDLRSEGFVSTVRHQGKCGSCWAFAATSAVESAVAKSMDGQMVDLSEQSLVDCAWNYKSDGCQGSMSVGAVFKYLKKYGIPTVRDYGPYLEEDGECKIKNMTQVYKIRGYVAVTPYSSNALKVALFKTGPVTLGVQITEKFMLYSSGVFYDPECRADRLNHAVTAVGFGYRYGDLYWIIKNSWGENWGQDGYILMSASDNNCGVMTSPVYPIY